MFENAVFSKVPDVFLLLDKSKADKSGMHETNVCAFGDSLIAKRLRTVELI